MTRIRFTQHLPGPRGATCPFCQVPSQARSAGDWCPRCRGWVITRADGTKPVLINSVERLGILSKSV